MFNVAPYRKFIAAATGGAAVVASVTADGSISAADAVAIIAAVLAPFGVFIFPNDQEA